MGRTGTFIALDITLDQMNAEKTVDIKGTVQKMREKRMYMIQTAVSKLHMALECTLIFLPYIIHFTYIYCIHTYIYMHACIPMYVHIYCTYIHTHIHTYKHVHIRTCNAHTHVCSDVATYPPYPDTQLSP